MQVLAGSDESAGLFQTKHTFSATCRVTEFPMAPGSWPADAGARDHRVPASLPAANLPVMFSAVGQSSAWPIDTF